MWDISPWPGVKPEPPALGTRRVNHWASGEVLGLAFPKAHVSRAGAVGWTKAYRCLHFPSTWVIATEAAAPAHGSHCNRGGRGRTLQKGVLGRLAGGVSVGAPHLQAHKLTAYDTQPLVGSACRGRHLQEAGGLVSSTQARELM